MFGQVPPGESPPDVAEAVCEAEPAPKPFSSLPLLVSSSRAEQRGRQQRVQVPDQEAGDSFAPPVNPGESSGWVWFWHRADIKVITPL